MKCLLEKKNKKKQAMLWKKNKHGSLTYCIRLHFITPNQSYKGIDKWLLEVVEKNETNFLSETISLHRKSDNSQLQVPGYSNRCQNEEILKSNLNTSKFCKKDIKNFLKRFLVQFCKHTGINNLISNQSVWSPL